MTGVLASTTHPTAPPGRLPSRDIRVPEGRVREVGLPVLLTRWKGSFLGIPVVMLVDEPLVAGVRHGG